MTTHPTDPALGARRLLFVCMGNICRSPLAKGAFLDLCAARGVAHEFTIDSCGTGSWHAGEGADPRAAAVARKHGITLVHTARCLRPETDFAAFDLLLAMDRVNVAAILAGGAPRERVRLLRSFDPACDADCPEVPDPYHGGDDGFERVLAMIRAACAGLLDRVLEEPLVKRERR